MEHDTLSSGEVEAALRTLSPHEELVLRLRYGIGKRPHDRAEIGRQFGVSRSRVRSIESRALERLRQASLLEFVAVGVEAAQRAAVDAPVRERGARAPSTRAGQVAREGSKPRPGAGEPPAPYGPNDPYPVNSVGWDEV